MSHVSIAEYLRFDRKCVCAGGQGGFSSGEPKEVFVAETKRAGVMVRQGQFEVLSPLHVCIRTDTLRRMTPYNTFASPICATPIKYAGTHRRRPAAL